MKKTIILAAMLAAAPLAVAAQDSFGGSGQQQQQQQPPPQQYPPQQQQPGWGQQPQQQPMQQPMPQQGGWGQPAQQPGQDDFGQPGDGWGRQPAPQPQPAPGSGAAPGGPGAGADLDQLMAMERQDYGVQPTKQLHSGQMHGPTPASIPGGQVITTKGLVSLAQQKSTPYFLFDTLGGQETLPNAMPAMWLAQPGSFTDQTQQQMSQMFAQGTQGRKDIPLIFYCASTQCWMSYNAALRAINAGYTNVLWYRGGLEAWKAAGLPTQPAQQNYPAPQPGYQQQPEYQQQGGYPQQQGQPRQ